VELLAALPIHPSEIQSIPLLTVCKALKTRVGFFILLPMFTTDLNYCQVGHGCGLESAVAEILTLFSLSHRRPVPPPVSRRLLFTEQ
jgi:hypothetical protein